MTPTPLELLLSGRYQELLAQMRSPDTRGKLLTEVVGQLDGGAAIPGRQTDAGKNARATDLSLRQLSIRASGDFSWGILSPAQRREFLVRDARLLSGSGTPDAGAAQLAALTRLRSQLGELYKSLDLALEVDDVDWLLPVSEHLAKLLEFNSDYASMRERYNALLDAALRIKSTGWDAGATDLELHARLGLSLAHSNLGEYAAAVDEAQAAAQLAEALGNSELLSAALHIAGSAEAYRGEFAPARELLSRALTLRRESGSPASQLASMSNLAFVEQTTGNLAAARGLLSGGVATFRQLGDRRSEALVLQNLAALEYSSGNASDALPLYEQALAISRELGDQRGGARAISGLGFAAYAAGEMGAAREWHAQSLVLCRATGDKYTEAITLNVLGAIELYLDQTETGREHFAAALELCTQTGDQQGIARANCGLGNAATQRGELQTAANHLAIALASFQQLDDTPGMLDALAYAGALLTEAGNQETAEQCLSGAQEQATLLGHHFDLADRKIIDAGSGNLQVSSKLPADLSLGQLVDAALVALHQFIDGDR